MKRMPEDSTEWVTIELPENTAKLFDDAHSFLGFGLVYDEEDGNHEILISGYNVHLEDTQHYHHGMATFTQQQLQQMYRNAFKRHTVIKLLQARSDALDKEIHELVLGLPNNQRDDQDIIHDMAGLLGQSAGQLRALVRVELEDDVHGSFTMKEPIDEAQSTDPDSADGDDSDGSGESDEHREPDADDEPPVQ